MPDITITVTDAEYENIQESVWRTGGQYHHVDTDGIKSASDVTNAQVITATKDAIINSTAQAMIYKNM